MGRLIDAGKILDNLSGMLKRMDDYDAVRKVINDMPTAYDVDAVVKQLKEMRSLYQRLSELKDRDHMKYIYKIETLSDAIEIVKAAGINDPEQQEK